jgi:hypothetical protein
MDAKLPETQEEFAAAVFSLVCDSKAESPRLNKLRNVLFRARMLGLDVASIANAQDSHGNTPLHRAVQSNFYGAAELLLNSGANPNLTNNIFLSPLEYALKKKRTIERKLAGELPRPRSGESNERLEMRLQYAKDMCNLLETRSTAFLANGAGRVKEAMAFSGDRWGRSGAARPLNYKPTPILLR